MYTAIYISLILLPIVVIVIAAWWNVNPFQYPYYRKQFNVTGKRLPKIEDYIDLYICSYIIQGERIEAVAGDKIEVFAISLRSIAETQRGPALKGDISKQAVPPE